MKILVSNDDGYQAPGILALVKALSTIAEVTVVAPADDRSAASSSLTVGKPVRIHEAGERCYYVEGTPADCVHIAVNGLLDFRPDLVVTGVNNGSNLGDDTIYSGTVAAAAEQPGGEQNAAERHQAGGARDRARGDLAGHRRHQ